MVSLLPTYISNTATLFSIYSDIILLTNISKSLRFLPCNSVYSLFITSNVNQDSTNNMHALNI